MNFMGEIIPLCPETRVGGKSTAANPDHVSAGVESAWYRGDPTMPRLFKAQHRGAAPDHHGMMKSILQGDFYNVRENGFSSIVHSQKAPDFSVDGSYFQPGVKGDMTSQQERAFFKKQAHDDLNRTYVSRIVKGDFMYGDLKKRPRLNVTNKIAQNRMAASKPNSRSQSALERRTGASPTAQSDWRPPQRREAERIANASGALFDSKAHYDVVDFLAKTSQENRESLEGLFGSMLGPTDRRPHATDGSDTQDTRPAAEVTMVHSPSGDIGAVRPGTASVMERSERDLQRTVAAQLHKNKPPGANDPQILTPKFGVTTLLKQRLMGHRAECTGKFGHLTSFEERIRDLRKALRDHIYVKVNDKKEAWKWVNPDSMGYIDVQSLFYTMREFSIDCTMEECAALHDMIDLDGDGLIGFEDMNNALFDTALGERDYFRLTDKPCSDVANERILFQGYQIAEKLGDTIQSDWARLSRREDNEKTGIIPRGRTDAARPQTAQTNYNNGRPATSATELSKLAPRPSTGQRPSTSMGMQQSLRKNDHQLWSDAARICALTCSQDSVEDIRKVLGKTRPVTAEPRSGEKFLSLLGTLRGAQHDTEQSGSKSGNSFARASDASVQQKIPGALPRNITAEQARQLMANSQAAMLHPVTNHAVAGHISAGVPVFERVRGRPSRIRPHQFHHVFGKKTKDLPPTAKVQAVSTNLHSNDKAARQGSSRDEMEPKPTNTSSFFLTASMGAVPARDGARNKAHVGVERPGGGSRTQTLTID